MIRREVNLSRHGHLIAGPVIITWSGRACSEAHPLIDGASVQSTTHNKRTGEITAWTAGGIAIRLWPVRTTRCVPLLAVAVDGRPAWMSPAHRRAIARQRAARDRRGPAGTDGTDWTAAHP